MPYDGPKDYLLTVRITTELRDRLEEMGLHEDRTLSNMVQRLLKEAVMKFDTEQVKRMRDLDLKQTEEGPKKRK